MLDWFTGRTDLPIDETTRRWIDERFSWLVHEFGTDRIRSVPVVLATESFFPDPYDGSLEAAHRLFEQMAGYLQLDPDTLALTVYDEHREGITGTAGLYLADAEGRFHIAIEAAGLADPLSLACTMAHELGHVHLLGHQRIPADTPDHEPLTDLLLVVFGLGVLAANSVVLESSQRVQYSYAYQMQRRGYLTMPMFGYALAQFARVRRESNPAWAGMLRPDVLEAFRAGVRELDRRNDPVPERVAARDVEIPQPSHQPHSREEVHTQCPSCNRPVNQFGMYCTSCQASIADNEVELRAEQEQAERPSALAQFAVWLWIGPLALVFLAGLLIIVGKVIGMILGYG